MAKRVGIEVSLAISEAAGLANVDVNQLFKRKGDNGDGDMSALTSYLNKISGVPAERSNQAGTIDGSGPPVNMAGAGIVTPGAFLPQHFGEA